MRGFVHYLFLMSFVLFHTIEGVELNQDTELSESDAILFMREHLKSIREESDFVEGSKLALKYGENLQNYMKAQCQICSGEFISPSDPKVFVFISFSVPESVWINLSKQLEKVDGVFVLRGLPQQSFKELATQSLKLKELGVRVPILLDPLQFQTHQITYVPTFVISDDKNTDKVSGNLSLDYVLSLFVQQGDTQVLSKKLSERLRDSK